MNEINTKVVGLLDLQGRHESALRVRDPNYISPSVITHTGGGHEPKIVTPCDFRYDEGLRERESTDVSTCISEAMGTGGGLGGKAMVKADLRIRKLTPRECWRLMDFTDEDFDKAQKVNSDSQLYKQAGNSIVVKVLEEIFKEML